MRAEKARSISRNVPTNAARVSGSLTCLTAVAMMKWPRAPLSPREIDRRRRIVNFAERDAHGIVVAECLPEQLGRCGP
jgi:hypothetical protein